MRWCVGVKLFALLAVISFTSIADCTKDDGPEQVSRNPPNSSLSPSHSILISGNEFLMDGEPFRYVSGSLHYFRLPWQLWRDRLKKMRAAGLNAVSTYVEWSFHEPEERQYRWTGDHDLVKFIQMATEEELFVLLRPGPYICAERDLGGLPYWLLGKYPNINLRTSDKDYMNEVTIWFDLLFEKMKPLLFGNGGPIIMVQIENEYGSYNACDREYMIQLRDLVKRHVGDTAVLYTTDGTLTSMIRCGMVNDTLTTIDFGSGTNPSSAFSRLRSIVPTGPLVNSEYYPGWLTHWGEKVQTVESKAVVETLMEMHSLGASVNFYVFFGGTNFEFTSGANFATVYQPDITSYDYDAPLTEYGAPTPKYYDIKRALEEVHPWAKQLAVSNKSDTAGFGPVRLTAQLVLLSPEGRSILGVNSQVVHGYKLPTFESRRQRAGLMLYETNVTGNGGRLLRVSEPRDRVYVFLNGVFKGVISRMNAIYSLPLYLNHRATLSLLVESQGRINYGPLLKDFKGILSNVTLDNEVLDGPWAVLGFPLDDLNTANKTNSLDECCSNRGPIVYEGTFVVDTPKDTFLDPTGLQKGYAWVNGHNLGRYWLSPGPQVTLYVPSVYQNPSPTPNVVQFLELESDKQFAVVNFRDKPIFINNRSRFTTN